MPHSHREQALDAEGALAAAGSTTHSIFSARYSGEWLARAQAAFSINCLALARVRGIEAAANADPTFATICRSLWKKPLSVPKERSKFSSTIPVLAVTRPAQRPVLRPPPVPLVTGAVKSLRRAAFSKSRKLVRAAGELAKLSNVLAEIAK